MKSVSRYIFIVITFLALALATSAHAQSPREQLNQMVQQLQKTPQDDALREKVIRLARETTPEPAVPPEALRHENTANTLFKNAKTRQDYLAAAREYAQALRHAPWAARPYFGLGEIHEAMADTEAGDRQTRAQIRQSCNDETRKEELQRFEGYEQSRKNFEYYLLAERNADEQVVAQIKHRIESRKLRIARWWHEWNSTCCDGCGGKQDSKKVK